METNDVQSIKIPYCYVQRSTNRSAETVQFIVTVCGTDETNFRSWFDKSAVTGHYSPKGLPTLWPHKRLSKCVSTNLQIELIFFGDPQKFARNASTVICTARNLSNYCQQSVK